MDTMGSTKTPSGNFYVEKLNIIGLFLEFERIVYVTKREKIKKHMTEKTFISTVVSTHVDP